MMGTSRALVVAFVVALAAGIAAAYGVVRLGAMVTVEGEPAMGHVILWLAPLGALAGFALIYPIGRGRALRLPYWLFGPMAVYAATGAGVVAFRQIGSFGLSLALGGAIAFAAALVLFFRDTRHG